MSGLTLIIRWLTRIIVLLIVGCIVVGCDSSDLEYFSYQVRVQNHDGKSVPDAAVTLTIGSNTPLRSTTDTEGYAIFAVPTSYLGKTGRLVVESEEYESYTRNVFLSEDAQLQDFKLAPNETVVSADPTVETSISTPTTDHELPSTATPQAENTFTCVMFNFGSYYPLLQIVQEGLDKQNGFDLEIIAWDMEGPGGSGDVPFGEIPNRMSSGEWDCLLDTLDGPAHKGSYGAITAIIDESAGADQVWVREDIQTINDMEGKRVSFVSGSTSEFMLYALLELVGLDKTNIVLVETDGIGEAIDIFNQGNADVVIGWEPDILAAEGRKLVDSSDLRYIVDVIVISHQAIDTKPDMVQAFHKAWFQALKIQFEDFPRAAQSIADWGNNDWTFVNQGTATADLQLWLESIAQAGYYPNLVIMQQNPEALHSRLAHARKIWSLAGISLPPFDVYATVDPQFVLGLQGDSEVYTRGGPYNDSDFLLDGSPPYPTIPPDILETVATLPCEKFEFLPDSTGLTEESKRILDECMMPAIRASSLYLRITGSSAWPGPTGYYSEAEITNFARRRAIAVAQYISNQGVDPGRFIIEVTIPPSERREITGPELEQDRFVRLELVRTGQR
ncbi:MAG: ABC transporter substrate-binding protein [Planctomycetes bacterium]|nr:ABC transporter substrate-binding protein [Planctomycetota bacterium]